MASNDKPPSSSLHDESPGPAAPPVAGSNGGNKAEAHYDSTKPSFAGGENSRPICRFFKRGFCKNGDACRFEHATPDEGARPEKPLCRNYQQGRCRYGDSCRFRHVEPSPAKKPEEEKQGTGEEKVKESGIGDELEGFPGQDVLSMLQQMGLHEEMTGEELAEDAEQRMRNFGFNDAEVEELVCHGVMPYDSDAETVLAFLQNDWKDYWPSSYSDGFWDSDDEDEDLFGVGDEDEEDEDDDEEEEEDEENDLGASEDSETDDD